MKKSGFYLFFLVKNGQCLTWKSIVDEFRAVFPSPGDVGFWMAGRPARQADVGSLTSYNAVRRPAVDDIRRHCPFTTRWWMRTNTNHNQKTWLHTKAFLFLFLLFFFPLSFFLSPLFSSSLPLLPLLRLVRQSLLFSRPADWMSEGVGQGKISREIKMLYTLSARPCPALSPQLD